MNITEGNVKVKMYYKGELVSKKEYDQNSIIQKALQYHNCLEKISEIKSKAKEGVRYTITITENGISVNPEV